MGRRGTKFLDGVIDGVSHVESGSATLVAGATTITTSLDSITGLSVTPDYGASATDGDLIRGRVNPSDATVLQIRGVAGSTNKVWYTAVGPRTTSYS